MSTEVKEEAKPKIFVWAKSERAGETVTADRTEGDFTYFTDGSKIFTNMISEMLLAAKDEANAFNIAQPFLTPGAKTTPVVKDTVTQPAKAAPKEINVMLEMLKKISAKNSISMPMDLNVPSKEVYDLFKDQMDITKADLNEQILELVLSQIDNLQEQLKPQAEEFIKNYYNGNSNRKGSSTNRGTTTSDRTSSSDAPDITY